MLAVVTGATGHLGANLVRDLLLKGYTVRALVRSNSRALDGLPVERVYGDVSDLKSLIKAFENAYYVFHAAGCISIRDDEWELLKDVNITGVANVIYACKVRNVHRLIHFSSIEALDRNASEKQVDETFPLAMGSDHSPYARSKAFGEELVRNAINEGLNAVILNPTSVIGPFDFKFGKASQAIIDLVKGRLPVSVHGKADWVDVRDVASAAISSAENAPLGERYILAGRNVSIQELDKKLEKFGRITLPKVYLPLWLIRMFVPIATLYYNLLDKEPLVTDVSLEALEGNWNISHEKAVQDLGYIPRSFDETLNDTVEWMMDVGYLNKQLVRLADPDTI
ncbi:MAG: NAD-dependent epimerase/dehydratase family protein [Anaerolineaceae bacterium]|nr:NAD-dependent epimerase/dehydratase family protein [Anaerolineaceae bacterium]